MNVIDKPVEAVTSPESMFCRTWEMAAAKFAGSGKAIFTPLFAGLRSSTSWP